MNIILTTKSYNKRTSPRRHQVVWACRQDYFDGPTDNRTAGNLDDWQAVLNKQFWKPIYEVYRLNISLTEIWEDLLEIRKHEGPVLKQL
jgi:hypothetical protein